MTAPLRLPPPRTRRVAGRLRLLTLPARHAYVDAVVPEGVDHLDTGPDPSAGWRPDPVWDPRTWAVVAPGVDVVHVHFGFDHVPPDVLADWVEVTRRHGVRFVLTVHDLRSPHQRDRGVLDAQLAVLVAAADVVLTLTPGAAAEVRRSFGREAVVVEHPAVFAAGPAEVTRRPGLVGVHLKSFRVNVDGDPLPALRAVADGAATGGGRLRVDVHRDADGDPRSAAVHEAFAADPRVSVCAHDRFDDEQLRRYLSTLSVSVQLHRWGTHSGWVEACHDVGTAVVSPDVGYLSEQWPAITRFPSDERTGADLDALAAAVTSAVQRPAPAAADPGWRRDQLARVRDVHQWAYAP